ncbi:hypothetical protein C8R45DRAFT_946553 [Mycena sanguinolenta]|nr:hypothetical protein C8R45DRAFT_946553 [Mycena sanguinolenta]
MQPTQNTDASDSQPRGRPATKGRSANKENESESSGGDGANKDDDDDSSPVRGHARRSSEKQVQHDQEIAGEESDDADEDDDEASPVRGRARRPSEKQAQHEQEKAEAEARKQNKLAKAAKAAQRKAGVVEEDTRPPIDDNICGLLRIRWPRHALRRRRTSPNALARSRHLRNSQAPTGAPFPRPIPVTVTVTAMTETLVVSLVVLSARFDTPSAAAAPLGIPHPFTNQFVASSLRTNLFTNDAKIRNINGGVVPDNVSLHLVHGDEYNHSQQQYTAPRRRRSPSPRCSARRSRSRSPRHVVPRLRSPTAQRSQPRSPRGSSPLPRSQTIRRPRPRSSSPHHRSLSPASGDKRHRSSSIDSEDLWVTQSQRIMNTTGRTRAKDLDDTTKEYAVLAIDTFRCDVSVKQAFPDSTTESAMVRGAWKEACEDLGMGMVLTPIVAKMIASRGSQLRGELKTKVRPLMDTMYGFKSEQNKKTIAFNRKLAEDLKEESTFAFKRSSPHAAQDVENKKGLYKNPIIQSVFNAMWFANSKDEGPRHPELFSPIPLRALALVLTAIENNIDERLTGIRTDVPFTANDHRAVYEGHVKALEQFEAHMQKYKLLENILKRLHSVGRPPDTPLELRQQ